MKLPEFFKDNFRSLMEKAEELLTLMKPEESKDLRKLLEYPENTACRVFELHGAGF